MRFLKTFLALVITIVISKLASGQYVQPMRYDNYSFTQQVNIGSGAVRVTDPSAYLEVGPTSGGNRGFLPPRLTTAQRDAITSPANGLMIYNTSTNAFNFYNGSSWTTFSSGGSGGGISQLGNTGNLWMIRVNDSTYAFDTATANAFYRTIFPRLSESYSNPTWISSLAWSKITGTPTTRSGYGITDAIGPSDTTNKWITATKRSNDSVFYQKGGVWVFSHKDSVGTGGGGGSPAGNFNNVQVNRNGSFSSPGLDSLTFNAGLAIKGVLSATALPTGGVDADSLVVINSSGSFKKRNVSAFARMNTTSAAGQLALFNGVGTVYSSSKFVFADASYPYMGMVGSDPLFYFGAISVNNPIIGSGAGLSLYGGDTYESINFYDKINSGTQIARFYNSGGTLYNNLNGLIISNTLSSPSNYQGSYTIQRTVPYAVTGLNYHGYTDQTDFRVGTNAFNSFGTFVSFGNNRTDQDHFAGFQDVYTKDSSNIMRKVYSFVRAVSSVKNGGVDTVFGYKLFPLSITGGGSVGVEYGIYLPASTATKGIGAYIQDNVGLGIADPTEKLHVSGNGLFTGTLKTGDPGSGAGAWKLGIGQSSSGLTLITNQYIEVSIGGTLYKVALVQAP